MASEKFCLKWNDFQTNITAAFRELRADTDFCDVTLVCEGNHQIKAHKVILVASSPVLMEMMRKTNHSHPLIYTRGVRAPHLNALVDFMYHGEANIYQEDLDVFLSLAEEFQLRGLTASGVAEGENEAAVKQDAKQKSTAMLGQTSAELTELSEYNLDDKSIVLQSSSKVLKRKTEDYIIDQNLDFQDLHEKLETMIEKVDGQWNCKVCGTTKLRNNKNDYTRHAETHLDGVSHLCNSCGKVFRYS